MVVALALLVVLLFTCKSIIDDAQPEYRDRFYAMLGYAMPAGVADHAEL
jgi:hypothetical protein